MIPFEPAAVLAALCGIAGAILLLPRPAAPGRARVEGPEVATLFYRDGALRQSNPAGRDFLSRLGSPDGLDALVERLSGAYPTLSTWIQGTEQEAEIASGAGGATLRVSRGRDGLRIGVERRAASALPDRRQGTLAVDRDLFARMEGELATLRLACDAVPVPVWRDAATGHDGWSNPAARSEAIGTGSFEAGGLERLAPGGAAVRMRASDERWWSVQRSANGWLSALPAGTTVAAESAARSYAMALVETFAHLPIGLMVFAQDGRLRTFNPAIAEMTGLDPATLALRPTLRTLLDRLREAGLLSGPGGREAWSARLDRLETGMRAGTFLETWDLTDGRSWRISGRPHPGGALALLIEDATTEAELSRRFDAGIEIGQAIADTIPDPLAAFARGGALLTANAAYAALWRKDPRTSLADPDAAAAVSTWRGVTRPDPVWDEIEELLLGQDPGPWSRQVPGPDLPLRCSATPMGGGRVLVRFADAAGRGSEPDEDAAARAVPTPAGASEVAAS